MKKASIIINNFNYSNYIIECIDSVLYQTYNNVEIILIDDGSTDDSINLIQNYKEEIIIVSKKNAGQLSTFNKAKEYISGDIVFFLDADDIYKNNYISEIMQCYDRNQSVDFIFSALERMFPNGDTKVIQKFQKDMIVGFSIVSTYYGKEWLGSATSCISMRRKLFDKILPIPFEEDWITRADDCLVWGSSILGANKYFFSKPLVKYRVHNYNNFYGKKFSNEYSYKRNIAINKLFRFFLYKNYINDKELLNLVTLEFDSRKDKNLKLLLLYIKIIVKQEKSIFLIIKRILKICFFYIK